MALFQKQFDICYSHLDPLRRVKLTSLLDFLQDVATAHSDSLGLTLEQMKRDGAFWVLISFDVTIHTLPQIDDRIMVETWSSGIKTVYGYRNYRMSNADGSVLLEASSVWVYMGWESMRPLRVPPEKAALFAPESPTPLPKKLSLPHPQSSTPALVYHVMRRDIDTNQHVNNVKYLELAVEALPAPHWESIPKRLELQFLHAAVFENTIEVYQSTADRETLCALRAPDKDSPYALIRFTF